MQKCGQQELISARLSTKSHLYCILEETVS